jgi:hypothetical protein
MDIHKPKPFHGWREFAKEVGIIVLGVLIALAAEQTAEAFRWRQRVEQARQAMRVELSQDDGLQAYARASITRCLALQLDAIQRGIDSRLSVAQVMAVAKAYRPPYRTWESDAFRSAVASDVSNHMAAHELAEWSGVYANIPYLGQVTEKEQELVNSLSDGLPFDRRISDAEADRMTRIVQGLRRANANLDLWSRVVLFGTVPIEAAPPASDRKAVTADARQLYGSCVVVPDLKPLPASDSQFDRAHRED